MRIKNGHRYNHAWSRLGRARQEHESTAPFSMLHNLRRTQGAETSKTSCHPNFRSRPRQLKTQQKHIQLSLALYRPILAGYLPTIYKYSPAKRQRQIESKERIQSVLRLRSVGCGSAHADQTIMSKVENQPLAGESHLSVSLDISWIQLIRGEEFLDEDRRIDRIRKCRTTNEHE